MRKIFLIVVILATSYFSTAQEALDTLFFVDGKIEAVQLTGLTESAVQYNYYGEGIPISTPKSRIEKIVTRAGRIIVLENTSQKKTV